MKKFVWVLLVALLLSVICVNLEPITVEVKADDQGYTPQPNYWNSTLSVYSPDCKEPGKKDWKLKKLLEKSVLNQSKGYHSAKFVFGQCYGGGFLDEVQQFGNDTHPVAAMSASKWDETAWGWPDSVDQPYSEFLHRLKIELDKYDGKNPNTAPGMKSAFDAAKKADVFGPFGKYHDHDWGGDTGVTSEHPQYVSVGAGADNLKLGNASGAKSWKALLFVGKDTHDRHRNNLKEIHDVLTKKYGYTEDDIEALCGDGNATKKGMPWLDGNATQASLENALKKIGDQMNSSEQFFFWANDHGDIEFSIYKWLTSIIEKMKEFIFSLTSWMIEDMKTTTTNFPYISMDTYNVTTTDDTVYLNDVFLGTLSYTEVGGTHHEIFYFDENILFEEDNVLTIFSMQETPFGVANVDISSGSIPEGSPPSVGYAHGPREDELLMRFYANVSDAYAALKVGDIDMVMGDIGLTNYLDAIENPSIQTISVYNGTDIEYWAYRNLLGVVNMDRYGLDNDYTFMNMRTVDGDRPTIGLMTPPTSQNVLMSDSLYDRQVMNRYYGASANISKAPYAPRDQPWVIQDWAPTIWIDPEDGVNKTKVVVWFRENVKWVSPVTGQMYDNFTAHDFAFSEWFVAAYSDAWTHNDKMDIHHIKIIDDYCIEIYMEEYVGMEQYVGDYVVNKALWQDKFCFIYTIAVVLDQDYVPCEKLWLRPYITEVPPGQGTGQILQVVDCTLDGVTLIEDIDFEIVMLEDDHTYFHWLTEGFAGQTLTMTFWTPDPAKPSPHGYWPGNYTWEQIAVGIGTHYLVDYVGGVGGYALFRANRHFWLETPVPDPKGADPCSPLPAEVDWIWEWGPRDADRPLGGPRTGNYTVDIADVVLCTAAYRSRGNSEPDPKWFPGADLAPPDCYIDIADVVTITGRYRRKFGGWTKCLACP